MTTISVALIYPSSDVRGIDIVTATDDEAERVFNDWHPMPGEPGWTTADATAALATIGYAPTGLFAQQQGEPWWG